MSITTAPSPSPVQMPAPAVRHRVLMCSPTAYRLEYEINPWMSLQNRPDVSLAAVQWDSLHRTLHELVGAQIELIDQAPECPDMVFTANAGLTKDGLAVPARFRHPERRLEEPYFERWFADNGYRIARLPEGCRFEGEGDALFVGDTLLAGYLKRSDIASHKQLSELFNAQVLSIELTDDRWYHLDTCLFALTGDTVVYYRGAMDDYAAQVIEANFDTITVNETEALRFACNSVVLGNAVVTPSGCPDLKRNLESRGYEVFSVELSEFLKAGGAAKCLTLHLR